MMPRNEFQPTRLEIVMDNYIACSTKNGTRASRGDKGNRIYITGFGQKMPDTEDSWNSLLNNSDNKLDLISLLR